MNMYLWNPAYNLVMKIKKEYEDKFGQVKDYELIQRKNDLGMDCLIGQLEYWIEKLDVDEYKEWKECLQFTYFKTYVLIRYGLQELKAGMWSDPDSIYRECRSVVIDLQYEEIVLAPFRKFFNINEVVENELDKIINEIKYAKHVEFSNKLDGSMQSARFYKGDIIMSGSKSLDSNCSWRLADGYSMLTEKHKKMISKNERFTFIFEYISLRDSHVVAYKKEEEGLYLIGMRNTYTGEELSYQDILAYSEIYGVPMSRLENKTFDEVLEESKTASSDKKEGWVINIDGHKVKLKCDDYVKLHRILDKVSSVNVIIRAIADGTYDDLISKVPALYRPRVEKVSDIIFNYVADKTLRIMKAYINIPKTSDKKEIMIHINQLPVDIKEYVRCFYLKKDYNLLKKNANGYKKLSDLGITMDYSALFSEE